MKGKLAFAVGVATGYVLGSRAGRTSYEHLKKSVKSFWAIDSVQEVVTTLEHEAKEATEDLGRKIGNTLSGTHPTSVDSSPTDAPSGSVKHKDPETPSFTTADVISDPALTDKVGHDWADEGGATPTGPASS